MKCPKCGQEVDEYVSVCPYCGAELHHVESSVPVGSGSDASQEVLTPENFRSAPKYKRNLLLMVIFGGIGFVFAGLSLFGSIMLRFGDGSAFDVFLLIFGLVGGAAGVVVTLSFNKKTFPTTQMIKMKGLEILVPVFIAFTLACLVGALVVQGYYLIVY